MFSVVPGIRFTRDYDSALCKQKKKAFLHFILQPLVNERIFLVLCRLSTTQSDGPEKLQVPYSQNETLVKSSCFPSIHSKVDARTPCFIMSHRKRTRRKGCHVWVYIGTENEFPPCKIYKLGSGAIIPDRRHGNVPCRGSFPGDDHGLAVDISQCLLPPNSISKNACAAIKIIVMFHGRRDTNQGFMAISIQTNSPTPRYKRTNFPIKNNTRQ